MKKIKSIKIIIEKKTKKTMLGNTVDTVAIHSVLKKKTINLNFQSAPY